MTRSTLICIAIALTLPLATAGAAHAAIYRGAGIDDPKVGVSFEKERRVIKRFTIERARFRCTDGDRFRAGTRVGRMRLNDRNRFRGRFTNSEGAASVRVRGRLRGKRAYGTFRMVTFFGAVECNTYAVEWKARRRASS